MAEIFPIIINTSGVIIGIIAIWIVVSIYNQYRLDKLLFFVASAVFILLWNFMHLILNFIPAENYDAAHFFWIIAILSGYGLVLSSLLGFNQIKEEQIHWRLIIYAIIVTFFITLFFIDDRVLDVAYDPVNGWSTITPNPLGWNLFSLVVFFLVCYEVIYPQITTLFKSKSDNRFHIILALSGILIAVFSNFLIVVLENIGWPSDFRFVVTDIGVLIWFVVIKNYPFTGIFDNTKLHQIIIAGKDGDPLKTFSANFEKAMLTSGAIIGVNTVLENINVFESDLQNLKNNKFRKIELGDEHYFIALIDEKIAIFHYSDAKGVCVQKFKTISNMIKQNSNLEDFELLINRFFPNNPVPLEPINV